MYWIIALGCIQIILSISALIVWWKTDDQMYNHIPKYGWLLIILAFSIIGPVLFLLLGRVHNRNFQNYPNNQSPAQINDVVTTLYGDRDQ